MVGKAGNGSQVFGAASGKHKFSKFPGDYLVANLLSSEGPSFPFAFPRTQVSSRPSC
ncbi:MAG: hypothetical protein ACI9G1_005142 [Pirellulaceae bacterium]|jgi:hypothetical protein